MPIFSPCPPTIANPIETKDILLLDETVNSKNYTRYAIRYTSPSGGTRTATLMFEFQIAWGSWYVDSVSIRQTFGGVQLIDNGGFESGTLGSHWKFCHAYYPWITASVSEQFCYVDRYCLSTTESFVPSLEYLTQAFNIRSNTQYDIEFFLLPVGDPLSAKVTMIAY